MSKLLIRPPKKDVNIATRNAAIEECARVLESAFAECSTLNLLHGAARLRALRNGEQSTRDCGNRVSALTTYVGPDIPPSKSGK